MEGMRLVCCCVWTGEELDLKGKAVCYGEAGARLGSMARAWGGFRVER